MIPISKNSWLNLTQLLDFNGILFWDATEYPDIPFSGADTYIQLTDAEAKRIDNIAFQQYGDSTLMWVLLLANDKDLPTDFNGGDLIRIPAITTINTLLRKKI